jgi:hypothetical protein
MRSEGLAYSEPRISPERPPAYGDGQLAYEPPVEVEGQLDRRTQRTLALAIFMPVVAAYGAIAYGLYLGAHAVF